MNGIDNPGFNSETNSKNNQNSTNVDHSNRKMSPFMLLSLTFHSLGIIFGDM